MKIILEDGALMPTRAHEFDAGLDLYAKERGVIFDGDRAVFDTGVHVQIPQGFVGLLTSKSGLMANQGLTSRGTIDSGYTGSIKVVLFNHGPCRVYIDKGQKISQLVVIPCLLPQLEVVTEFEATDRGSGGFGSTGR